MSGQINLWKKGETPEVRRVEWAGWITGCELGTFEDRVGFKPIPHSSKNTETMYGSPEKAEAALQALVAEKIREGFVREEEVAVAPTPDEAPSKPWGKKPKVEQPKWLAKPPADLAKALAKLRSKIKSARIAHRAEDIESLARASRSRSSSRR